MASSSEGADETVVRRRVDRREREGKERGLTIVVACWSMGGVVGEERGGEGDEGRWKRKTEGKSRIEAALPRANIARS